MQPARVLPADLLLTINCDVLGEPIAVWRTEPLTRLSEKNYHSELTDWCGGGFDRGYEWMLRIYQCRVCKEMGSLENVIYLNRSTRICTECLVKSGQRLCALAPIDLMKLYGDRVNKH